MAIKSSDKPEIVGLDGATHAAGGSDLPDAGADGHEHQGWQHRRYGSAEGDRSGEDAARLGLHKGLPRRERGVGAIAREGGSDAATAGDYQIVVASDEREFLQFMEREFGLDHVVFLRDAPRSRAGGPAIHFDRTSGVSNYEKGKAGLLDCRLLATSDYLIKGRSNLSDASLVFNPGLPYSLCLR